MNNFTLTINPLITLGIFAALVAIGYGVWRLFQWFIERWPDEKTKR